MLLYFLVNIIFFTTNVTTLSEVTILKVGDQGDSGPRRLGSKETRVQGDSGPRRLGSKESRVQGVSGPRRLGSKESRLLSYSKYKI